MSNTPNTGKPVVLAVAGFDPSCGAGTAADLKTISACGGYGVAVLTALTIQNSVHVQRVVCVEPIVLRQQLECLLADVMPRAVKIGMLASRENVDVLADVLGSKQLPNVVLDPVLFSSSGHSLLTTEALETFKSRMLPLAGCVTPNIDEAEWLTGFQSRNVEGMKEAAVRLVQMGCKAAVITGGHLPEPIDVLFDGQTWEVFSGTHIDSNNTHGTGCTFSSAIATYLALEFSLRDAIARAKQFVSQALLRSFPVGRGHGPLNHFF
jgi:hydroxymethylpyrimidine/phosphomethylpyrimidine kinase